MEINNLKNYYFQFGSITIYYIIKINQKYSNGTNILFEEIFEVIKINRENLETIVKRKKKAKNDKPKKKRMGITSICIPKETEEKQEFFLQLIYTFPKLDKVNPLRHNGVYR